MPTRLSAETQLSSALQCLHLVIVEKGIVTDELQANNQELAAILEALLNVRSELRAMATNGDFPGVSNSDNLTPDPNNLDFPQLKREADLIVRKGRAAVQESSLLRTKSAKVRAALLHAVNGHAQDAYIDYDKLSKREAQVLALIVAGKSSKQVAVELGISFKTAVTHRASIMDKMQVHEIASVVREAIRRGLA